MPGSGLSSATHQALPLFPETSMKFKIGLIRFWQINHLPRPWLVTNNTYSSYGCYRREKRRGPDIDDQVYGLFFYP